jgi:hypothetical protein
MLKNRLLVALLHPPPVYLGGTINDPLHVYLPPISLNEDEGGGNVCEGEGSGDLDPRSPIFLSSISSDITLPPVINGAGHQVSLTTLVTRALGLPRSLALLHNHE